MTITWHLSTAELEAAVDHLRAAPVDGGTVEMVVRRPEVDGREVLDEVELTRAEGMVGDSWRARGSRHTPDGSAEVNRQLTLMSARAADAIAGGDRERWPLAGDQLFVDLDLSEAGLPPGSRLRIGTAVVEITPEPHNGCAKFRERFGADAVRFVNSPVGKALHLRGVNARVVTDGVVRTGDVVRRA